LFDFAVLPDAARWTPWKATPLYDTTHSAHVAMP